MTDAELIKISQDVNSVLYSRVNKEKINMNQQYIGKYYRTKEYNCYYWVMGLSEYNDPKGQYMDWHKEDYDQDKVVTFRNCDICIYSETMVEITKEEYNNKKRELLLELLKETE